MLVTYPNLNAVYTGTAGSGIRLGSVQPCPVGDGSPDVSLPPLRKLRVSVHLTYVKHQVGLLNRFLNR